MNHESVIHTSIEIRMLIGIIAKLSHEVLEAKIHEHVEDMSHLQFGILRMADFEPVTITELSRRFSLAPSTLVPAVDALERRSLVARNRDPADRRRVIISLTPAGRETVRTVPLMGSEDPMCRAVSQLSPEQADSLHAMLKLIVRHYADGDLILSHISQRLSAFIDQHHPQGEELED